MNYFQLFGIDSSFDIDVSALKATYQQLQKSVHPDRFAHASAQEQLLAVQKSSMINDAFDTLKQPISRAEYMLTERGVVLADEQATVGDMSFLMRQMELREMLEEILTSNDAEAALEEARETLEGDYQTVLTQLRAALIESTPDSNNLAADTVRKLKFYHKLLIELDRIEDQVFDD
ncbi:co-chaperone HscB [Thalassotalea agarivorans]|uniref:Co-chaperone protein HscB homolog n=1 Tax=Thalassotalea agarivorans TaxID=349064 RepID=A0A1H9YP95_THASX|nr:co-chaperone HscB [Thalassotalea agarivorans]SES70955.1 Co-chaperone protein HscB [Thalassotalea agarivorans]